MSVYSVQVAVAFEKANKEAFWESWRNLFLRRPNKLLSFTAVKKLLDLQISQDIGIQEISIDDIVGSVGRSDEFSRAFKPKHRFTQARWQRVAESFYQKGFDPIKAIKVSNVYFVVDGNHRVSVSRAMNNKTIIAHIVEFETPITLDKKDDLINIRAKIQAAQSSLTAEEAKPSPLMVALGLA